MKTPTDAFLAKVRNGIDNVHEIGQEYTPLELMSRLSEVEEPNAPAALYVSGDVDLLRSGRRVSVVGTRNPSRSGIMRTRSLVKELVDRDIIVVSGLAEGIDTVAHRATIEFDGRTIAILGTPLNTCYPPKNADLKQLIEAQHVVVSQFKVGTPIQRRNFPLRNRTMALLSDATIIVEASEKSGTRHQGWEALRLGRDVFILENVINNPTLTWPCEMIKYGAQVLTRENVSQSLENLPIYTDRSNVDEIDF